MDLIAAIILIVLSAVVFLFVGIIIANTINSKRASSQYAQDSYQTPPNDQGTVQNGIEHLFIPKKPSSTSLMCGGVVFAIIAIVLFVLSIKEVGNMYIANTQDTVFSAASAVASVVCFVGVKVVNTVGNAMRR